MTDLRELEKRLEEATGPSKELDDAVFRACGLKVYPYDEPSGTTWGAAYPVTKSLDAAVALVERLGFFYRLQRETPVGQKAFSAKYWASVGPAGAQEAASAETGPVALMLALIRALIAKGDRHD